MALATYADSEQQCCKVCDDGVHEKYYSIDKWHNMCGECCMAPKDFKKYHFFERGLTKANSSSPCADLGYPTYGKTVTHGAFNFKMTLDLYEPAKPAKADQQCCETCDDKPHMKYYSIDHLHNMCGECCMDPKDFPKYHFFERGLTKANSTTPCADLKYPTYSKTVTHGAFNFKMTLDLYKPEPKPETGVVAAPQCCLTCDGQPKQKYYSVDHSHNMCGECCMDPKDFWKYHLFEPGLKKANSSSPCADLKYGGYDSTVTHGFLNFKMTLDLYKYTGDAVEVENALA